MAEWSERIKKIVGGYQERKGKENEEQKANGQEKRKVKVKKRGRKGDKRRKETKNSQINE